MEHVGSLDFPRAPREKVGKLSSFWDWWVESLFVSIIVSKYIIFPRANSGRLREKKKFLAKRFAHAISVHYRDFEHAYVYWIWLRASASSVITLNWQMEVSLNHDHNEMKSFERIITATIFQLKVSLVRLF